MRPSLRLVALVGILGATGLLVVWFQYRFSPAATIDAIAQSHIDANVPPSSTFDSLLRRDLTQYFQASLDGNLTIDFDLLRRGPTQTGISYPKFYLWVQVHRDGKLLKDGYARVQAVDRTGFDVTNFIPRATVDQDSSILYSVFPVAVAAEILRRQRM
jgi:hypothetical protein